MHYNCLQVLVGFMPLGLKSVHMNEELKHEIPQAILCLLE